MIPVSEYDGLSRQELVERLSAAEAACVMFGWTAASFVSDRDKAATELWIRWSEHTPEGFDTPRARPELVAAEGPLARQRDETRQRTLAKIEAASR